MSWRRRQVEGVACAFGKLLCIPDATPETGHVWHPTRKTCL
ncbi:MAG: hypothetical protein ACKERG_04270 [Candidatus Hodgkinia cicadicola]